jgi:endonuclease/exonuclease/phosphatase family metal-dependent hydrolase
MRARLRFHVILFVGGIGSSAAACAATTGHLPARAAADRQTLSCRQIKDADGHASPVAVAWHDQDAAGTRATLDAWCRGVGPVVHQSRPLNAPGESPSVPGPIAVASWNVNVGAGDLAPLVADLRAGKLSGGRRVEHFVLLLQEVLRTGDTVPPGEPSQSGARRLMRTPPRVDIVDFARDRGLSLLYVPSMRNGLDPSAPAEDRGNAILSTLPLDAPMALELPFVRQRRVAVFATLGGLGEEGPIGVASVHLDPFVGANRLWLFGAGSARGRQARAITAVLPPHGPVVVGGDFNAWLGADEPALREMARISGQPAPVIDRTFASGAVLDYLFFRTPASWGAMTYHRASHAYGSDHYPLVAWICPESVRSAHCRDVPGYLAE